MQALSLKILTCATANLTLAASVGFGPVKVFVNLSIKPSTCFLRMQAWEYFVVGCMGQSGSARVYAFDRVMVQHQSLKFLFRLPYPASPCLLIMMSIFFHRFSNIAGLTGTA